MAAGDRMSKLYRNLSELVNDATPRRAFLAALLWGCAIGHAARAKTITDEGEDKVDETAIVTAALRQSGLGPVRTDLSSGYLAIGDASASFLQAARRLCEALARDFIAHFQIRKFAVTQPAKPLTLIVLSGPDAYAKLLGIPQDEAVGGHYDLDTNRLVLFDNRARADVGPLAARANTVALMHEAAHQLCFNTGLLDRRRDVPKAVSEGLAVYCETRRPDGRTRIGQVNTDRRDSLVGHPLIPVADLLTKDALFDEEKTQQVAYAEAWLLTHLLMQSPESQARFQAYLGRIRDRSELDHRIEDF